jgi:hypothetical protein
MHIIDTAGAVDGRFVEGNPQNGRQATRVGAKFMNTIMDEIATVVAAAGIVLDDDDNTQLFGSITALIGGALADGGGAVTLDQFTMHDGGTSGWRREPDGWTTQWKRGNDETGTEAAVYIEFPIPFPIKCFDVQVTTGIAGGATTPDAFYQLVSMSRFGCYVLREKPFSATEEITYPLIRAIGH